MDSNQNDDQNEITNEEKIEKSKLKFQDDIFTALSANQISDEEKGVLLTKMLDLVESRALDRVLDELSPEDKSELEKIVNDDNIDAWEKMLQEKVPTYPQIYEEEAEKLRNELIVDLSQ